MEINAIAKKILGERNTIKDPENYKININTVAEMMNVFTQVMYPEYTDNESDVKNKIQTLNDLIRKNLVNLTDNYEEISNCIIEQIPHLIDCLDKDAVAIYRGDPSAKTKYEIIKCYPGFLALIGYRVAHILYKLDVPVLPRAITEYYHSITGIDINPGAEIGEYFCIDHGTEIVIGETAVIGNHVRIYHGVTLGTKGFKTDEEGFTVRGIKRHPNIGNNVTIYANATILGGDTFIGDNCIIGANSFVTESVKENSVVKKCPLESKIEYRL